MTYLESGYVSEDGSVGLRMNKDGDMEFRVKGVVDEDGVITVTFARRQANNIGWDLVMATAPE